MNLWCHLWFVFENEAKYINQATWGNGYAYKCIQRDLHRLHPYINCVSANIHVCYYTVNTVISSVRLKWTSYCLSVISIAFCLIQKYLTLLHLTNVSCSLLLRWAENIHQKERHALNWVYLNSTVLGFICKLKTLSWYIDTTCDED